MDKSAKTDHPIIDPIRQRWSPRAFTNTPVEAEKLRSLFEAARWAASSRNEQPWNFIIATQEDADAHARLASCLGGGNTKWAPDAPVLILIVAKLNFERNDKPNGYARYDVGQAVATLAIQATSMGLHLHQMAGFDKEKAQEVCHIPETHQAVTMIALGYLGEPSQLPKDLQEREAASRSRKPLSEFVFAGTWAQAAPLVEEA